MRADRTGDAFDWTWPVGPGQSYMDAGQIYFKEGVELDTQVWRERRMIITDPKKTPLLSDLKGTVR